MDPAPPAFSRASMALKSNDPMTWTWDDMGITGSLPQPRECVHRGWKLKGLRLKGSKREKINIVTASWHHVTSNHNHNLFTFDHALIKEKLTVAVPTARKRSDAHEWKKPGAARKVTRSAQTCGGFRDCNMCN